jgi:hypothetical protein
MAEKIVEEYQTEREKELTERFNAEDVGRFDIRVVNRMPNGLLVSCDFETIELAMHKIKLDIMTLAHFEYVGNAEISVSLVPKKRG